MLGVYTGDPSSPRVHLQPAALLHGIPKAHTKSQCLMFRVQGLGFRVEDLGLRVQGVGFRV